MGHWNIPPKTVTKNNNKDISKIVKFIQAAYTATKEKELHKRYVKFHNMILTETGVKTFLRDLDGNYSKDLLWISDVEQFKKQRKD